MFYCGNTQTGSRGLASVMKAVRLQNTTLDNWNSSFRSHFQVIISFREISNQRTPIKCQTVVSRANISPCLENFQKAKCKKGALTTSFVRGYIHTYLRAYVEKARLRTVSLPMTMKENGYAFIHELALYMPAVAPLLFTPKMYGHACPRFLF